MGLGTAAVALDSCTPEAVKKESTSNKELRGEMLQNYPGVGILGYGCMRWPQKRNEQGRNVVDQEEVNRLVDFALEHGVNYYDTAPSYIGGECEHALLRGTESSSARKLVAGNKLSAFGNTTYDGCVAMYRRSMEIFKTDYIDYYLLHSVPNENDLNNRFARIGIMDFLLKERELGRIRSLSSRFRGNKEGFDELMVLHDKYRWDFVQIQMNYIDWENAGGRNAPANYLCRT